MWYGLALKQLTSWPLVCVRRAVELCRKLAMELVAGGMCHLAI